MNICKHIGGDQFQVFGSEKGDYIRCQVGPSMQEHFGLLAVNYIVIRNVIGYETFGTETICSSFRSRK